MPQVRGVFIQMEDELASITAILGASAAGARTMTATSGPGLSLMMENIGLGVMLEIPCVIVDVQRGSPSTGLPTMPGQSDVMQVRWGSHGDFRVIAYSPWSPQEMFDLTVLAFNMADRYRVPVILLADEVIGHMVEKLEIHEEGQIQLSQRKRPSHPPNGRFDPFLAQDEDLVPPMAHAGEGYRVHFTGLTHDEHGYPAMDADVHHQLVTRLVNKIQCNASEIMRTECYELEDARIAVVAYGCTARSARSAVRKARQQGIPVGLLRLVSGRSPWSAGGKKIDHFMRGMNLGQISGKSNVIRRPVKGVFHGGGEMITQNQSSRNSNCQ
jgi:2-oxoglutarate ferredoxin oxidoreductase subunit alpha